MKNLKPINPFTPQEVRRFILPLLIATISVIAFVFLKALSVSDSFNLALIGYCALIIIYMLAYYFFMPRLTSVGRVTGIINSLIIGLGLGVLPNILPANIFGISHILVIFGTLTVATISGQKYAYLTMFILLLSSLPKTLEYFHGMGYPALIDFLTPVLVSIGLIEVIVQIQDTTKQHIYRLETINHVSRKIMQSLDPQQILSLLDATIQDTLTADTYFIGFQDGDEIRLDLFFDDGEYFNGTKAPLEHTLSGWVIKHQKEIFLPDLRENIHLEGVELLMAGKEKTSLSWIGVPLKAENLTGILTLASYTANAFDRADLELLISLGQHVTLALDNAIQHEKVEKQAKLDSLTGTYNHGAFLDIFTHHAETAKANNQTLSVIMLDIDYFKQYNDSFGHLTGDRVLTALCTAIQNNIKQTDAVGRWGGEEFIISLPATDGKQACKIAKRISETLGYMRINNLEDKTIPTPTISQGIAVFPDEAEEIYKLIDIADKRLYTAKDRGRNQIEPNEDFWK